MDFSSRDPLFRALYGAEHTRMREATAQDAGHSFLDFFFRGPGILIKKGFGGEDHAVQAEAALRSLLLNECFLYRVWLVDGA
jgi:hypothetical protein